MRFATVDRVTISIEERRARRRTTVWLTCYAALVLLSSVPFFARHDFGAIGGIALPFVYVVLLGLVLHAAFGGAQWHGLAQSRIFAVVAIDVLALANYLLFPGTRLVEHPSSAPDAIAVPVARLLEGLNPYGQLLFDGAPISPGPGWIALNAIFAANGLMFLILPVWLGLATVLITLEGAAPGLFVALVLAPLDFLQMSVVGHDIFAISLAVIVTTALAFRVEGRWLVAVAILAGTIATARLPLIILPPIIGLALWRRGDLAAGLRFTAIATVTACVWHGAAYAWCFVDGVFYQPLHIFHRADSGAGQIFTFAGAGFGVAAALWILFCKKQDLSAWLWAPWLLQTALFLPIGLGELVNLVHFDWANWEGKNYIAYPLPLLAAALALDRGPLFAAEGR